METKQKLTKKDALEMLEHIERIKGDDEQAHSEEDALKDWFIESLASNLYTKKEAVEIAEILNKVKQIEFSRWTA